MSGQSTQNATTTQNQTQNTSQTQNPWNAALPALYNILQGVQSTPTGLSPLASQGITGLTNLAQAGNPYSQSIGQYATNLLGGGNALAQNPLLTSTLGNYQSTLNPYTQPGYVDPMTSPYLGTALQTLGTDITGQINSQFAQAGRDLSPANTTALARGLSQGFANPLLQQYNTNVATQLGAAGAGYGAGNTTAGALQGAQQTFLGNQGQGVGAANAALAAQQEPYQQMLTAASLQTGIPLQTLQSLAQIGVPIAGLGGTTTGTANLTGTTNTAATYNPSLNSQIWGWMNAFGNLYNKGGGGAPGGTGSGGVTGAAWPLLGQ